MKAVILVSNAPKKRQNKVVTETAEVVVAAEEVHVVSAKDQIKAVKTQVEVMKADPKADKTIIATKEALIKQVEEKAALLEQPVKASKEAIVKAKSFGPVAPKAN
ncbi:MAG: hypothetical protein IPN95_31705 [Bacteroidetes bacterium]|nr:hypothetical protein [Bacteroidota bacterium]